MDTTSGTMDASISDIGKGTSWMILAYILGKTGECMKVSTWMTRSMAMESIHGQTRKNILVGGIKESNMA